MNINKWIGIGRLADDVRYTPANGNISSKAIGRLIINRPPNKDGQRRYDAVSFVAWGSFADNLAKYTSRGKELGIEGALHVNSTQDATTGKWSTYVEIQVRDIQFGRDSQTAKVMKASMDEADVPPVGGVADYMETLLQNPEHRQKIIAAAMAAGLNSSKVEQVKTPVLVVQEDAAPNPFQD